MSSSTFRPDGQPHCAARPVKFRQIGSDQRGVAGIEFAMALPFLAALLMGIVEFGAAYLQNRHTFQAAASLAQTAADISVAKLKRETGQAYLGENVPLEQADSETAAILKNGMELAFSKNKGAMKGSALRVVRVNGSKLNKVWEWKSPGAPRVVIDQSALLSNMKDGESLVVADVQYNHKLYFGVFGKQRTLKAQYAAAVPRY